MHTHPRSLTQNHHFFISLAETSRVFISTPLNKFGHVLKFSPISKGTCVPSDGDAFPELKAVMDNHYRWPQVRSYSWGGLVAVCCRGAEHSSKQPASCTRCAHVRCRTCCRPGPCLPTCCHGLSHHFAGTSTPFLSWAVSRASMLFLFSECWTCWSTSELWQQRSAGIESIYSKWKVLWLVFSSFLFFLFFFFFVFGGYLSFGSFEPCLCFAKYESLQLPLQSVQSACYCWEVPVIRNKKEEEKNIKTFSSWSGKPF